jgi:hypothetical protein
MSEGQGGLEDQGVSTKAYVKQKEFLSFLKSDEKAPRKNSQDTRERMSLAHGGKSLMVKRELEKGITDPEEIKRSLGLTTQQLADVRKTGIDVPRTLRDWKKTVEIIGEENDNINLQEILNSFRFEEIARFMQNNKDQTVFVGLGNLMGELGFVRNVRLLGEKLRENGIPVGEYSRLAKGKEKPFATWVIYGKHKQEISNVADEMSKSGELKKSPK